MKRLFLLLTGFVALSYGISAPYLLAKGTIVGGWPHPMQISWRCDDIGIPERKKWKSHIDDFQLEILSIGIGVGWKRVGVIASTKLIEAFNSPWGEGDDPFDGALMPLYLYVVSGLIPHTKYYQPVTYFFTGTSISRLSNHGRSYLTAGIGVKWTILVTSLALEAGWMREGLTDLYPKDLISLRIRLELGGWYALKR